MVEVTALSVPIEGPRAMAKASPSSLLLQRPVEPDMRNHLTLVEKQYYLQTANLHPKQFEALVYYMAEAISTNNDFLHLYVDLWLLMSGSVDGRRSDQLVKAMQGDVELKRMAARDVIPDLPNDPLTSAVDRKVKKFGLGRR